MDAADAAEATVDAAGAAEATVDVSGAAADVAADTTEPTVPGADFGLATGAAGVTGAAGFGTVTGAAWLGRDRGNGRL